MPPTRAAEPASAPAPPSPQPVAGVPLRFGRLARLEAWWWTGPLGHLAAGASDLVPLFARYWLYLGRQRAARRLASLRGRRGDAGRR